MFHSHQQASSYPHSSDPNESPEQQLQESLEKYLNLPHHQNCTDKLKKQIFIAEIESINSDLSTISKDRFGDLTQGIDQSPSQWAQIEKTIKLTKNLISHIHKESQAKKELIFKHRKAEQEIARQSGIHEKNIKQKRNLEKQKQSLELKIKSLERQFKEDIEKLKKQKDEAEKKFSQISNKQNQYKNQMRKNQQTIIQLQQKIKNKGSSKTDQTQVKNRFDIIEEVKSCGPSLVLSNSENEFNKFFMNNFESKHRTIVEENDYLKKCLENVYRQLHELLEVKRQTIKKRKGFESALDSDAFALQNMKPEVFGLPKEYSQDALDRLYDNLHKFKEAVKINELVNEKVQDQKVNCINNVKRFLGNYKEIVQSQDKLINRVVLKSKELKANEMANIEGKYSRLEEDELEKSKKFLEEQRQILMSRNKELESTRKAMKNTIKKAEEERKMFCKKKAETNEQLQVLKKNIERLPAVVEQQISSMI